MKPEEARAKIWKRGWELKSSLSWNVERQAQRSVCNRVPKTVTHNMAVTVWTPRGCRNDIPRKE